jgi:hypothetical protein
VAAALPNLDAYGSSPGSAWFIYRGVEEHGQLQLKVSFEPEGTGLARSPPEASYFGFA